LRVSEVCALTWDAIDFNDGTARINHGKGQVDHFVQQQARDELAATTINRRLNALKHFFDYLVIEQQVLGANTVKPSHFLRRGRPLPKKLSQDQVKQLFAQIENPMDHALCLLMLRCGLRVSEVAKLKLADIDWEQKSLLVEQGKGRKDRVVYLSSDASRKSTWTR
jgi:site-specific recombinase XerD